MARKITTKTAPKKRAVAQKRNTKPIVPPQNDFDLGSLFVGNPKPLNHLYYSADEYYDLAHENTLRMLSDGVIYSSLQERANATAQLDWSIVPHDEHDADQELAADHIERICKRIPRLTEMLRSMLETGIWQGRAGTVLEYAWDFITGGQEMVVARWVPVAGDSLVFGDNGTVAYRVGATWIKNAPQVTMSVEGRTVVIKDEQRENWIVFHNDIAPGDYWDVRSAGQVFGRGLRHRCYGMWSLKMQHELAISQVTAKFGGGWITGWYDAGNPESLANMKSSLEKQIGSCVQLFPRTAPEGMAVEGVEVHNPPSGLDYLLDMLNYYNEQLRYVIAGQSATQQQKPQGIGGGASEVHEHTFARLVNKDRLNLQETLSHELVNVLQCWNGYEHLPPMRWEFSNPAEARDKLESGLALKNAGVNVPDVDLLQAAGFPIPTQKEQKHETEKALKIAR